MIKNYLLGLSALLLITSASAQPAFTDGTALLAHEAHSGGCMAVTDMDGDGLDDVVQLDDSKHVHVLYQEADGSFTHVDYGQVSGNDQWGWAIADLYNDGHKDIVSGGNWDGTHLVRITARNAYTTADLNGPNIFQQNMSMADIDNDGQVDIYACNDVGAPNLWFTNGSAAPAYDGDYIDWSTDPASDMSGNYGSCFTDFDNDGDLDLHIAHCRQGVNNADDPRRWNRLFVNDGNGQYTDMAAEYGVQDHEQTWATDFGDFDNDGDLDMMSIEHSTGNQLFENDGTGHYTNVTAGSGMGESYFPLQCLFRDLDNDGFLDILIAGGSESYYKGHGDGTFTPVSGLFPSGKAMHSLAFGDLNRDGFEDVYANYGNSYVDASSTFADRLWLNTPNGNHFFRVRLQGTVSNRDAIGARVTITGPWGVQVREIRSGESYGLVNSFVLSFGLGMETSVPTMTIHWPSGLEETFTDLHADQTITVVEGTCISPNVAIAASPSLVLCPDSGAVTLTASPGTAYTWNTGEQGATISVMDPGTYWVLAGEGACITQANANVLSSPDETPSVAVAGETSICPNDQVVLTSSPAASYLWSNGSDQQSIAVSAAGEYTVTIQGSCASFTSAPVTVNVLDAPAAPASSDVTIPVPGTAELTATGDSIMWYDTGSSGTPIGQGSPWTTPFLNVNTTFWCADLGANGGDASYGGKTDRSTAYGHFQDNSSYYLLFSTGEDMVINSVKVYANGDGDRSIALVDRATDQVLASGDFFIPDGESRVQLDWTVPADGNYALRSLSDDPQLWRDGMGSFPDYPYNLAGLGIITGSSANASSSYYYFFYDWEVSAPAHWCEGPRTAVEVLVGPTGIADDAGASGFRLFPNPATNRLTIQGERPKESAELRVVDLTGRTVLAPQLQGMTIDITSLAAGTYTLVIRDAQGIKNAVFMKQ